MNRASRKSLRKCSLQPTAVPLWFQMDRIGGLCGLEGGDLSLPAFATDQMNTTAQQYRSDHRTEMAPQPGRTRRNRPLRSLLSKLRRLAEALLWRLLLSTPHSGRLPSLSVTRPGREMRGPRDYSSYRVLTGMKASRSQCSESRHSVSWPRSLMAAPALDAFYHQTDA